MKIAITGASGLIGTASSAYLGSRENHIVALQRGDASSDNTDWNPQSGALGEAVGDCEALIHLAAEPIIGRWTEDKKARIRDSRVAATEKLCRALAQMPKPPRVLICASGTGFYGNRGDELLDENSASGDDFLAHLARDWEDATRPASDAGIRVVNLRLGLVLSERGGALAASLPAFRMGLGGVLGNGRQWWSWIALEDVAAIIEFALHHDELNGAINVVAPQPVTNREFTRTLNGVLRRPNFFPVPEPILRLAMGEAADALVLSSARVQPKKLLDSGFKFQRPQLTSALRAILK